MHREALFTAICLGLSMAYEKWVDQPAIRLSKRFARVVTQRLNRSDQPTPGRHPA